MKSIKSMRRYVLTFSATIITIAIIINFQTQSAFKNLNDLEKSIDKIEVDFKGTHLPIRVLKNISSQDLGDEGKQKRLEDAFNQNIETLLYSLQEVIKLGQNINIEQNELVFFEISFNKKQKLKRQIKEMDELFKNMRAKIYELVVSDTIQNISLVEEIERLYEEINSKMISFQDEQQMYSIETRGKYINVFNWLFITSIVLVVLMGIAVHRILSKDFEFISKTYKQIDEHDYDIKKVIDKKPFFEEEIKIYEVVEKLFEEQKISTEFKNLVSKSYVIDDMLDLLLREAKQLLNVDRVGIAFIDKKKKTIVAEYGVATYEKLALGVGYEVKLKKTSLNDIVKNKKGIINNDVKKTFEKNKKSNSLKLILKEGIKSNMIIPLILNDEVFGMVFFSSLEKNQFTSKQFDLASKMIYEVTGALNRAYLMKVVLLKMTTTFAELVDKKDIETGDHILRMVKYSKIIAEGVRKLDLETHKIDKKMVLEIERNAAIHDIGKVGIPDKILKKPAKLTNEEFEIMKSHAGIGGEIFKALREELSEFNYSFYEVAEDIARYHHEKYDGTGYPEGLKGTEIPLSARIVALADVFDALTSERVYKRAFSVEETLNIIEESSGKHFDPVVVDAFYNQLDKIKEVYNKYN